MYLKNDLNTQRRLRKENQQLKASDMVFKTLFKVKKITKLFSFYFLKIQNLSSMVLPKFPSLFIRGERTGHSICWVNLKLKRASFPYLLCMLRSTGLDAQSMVQGYQCSWGSPSVWAPGKHVLRLGSWQCHQPIVGSLLRKDFTYCTCLCLSIETNSKRKRHTRWGSDFSKESTCSTSVGAG